jgi:threonine dehydrogenase-like Zn-dependent dehydrogenase
MQALVKFGKNRGEVELRDVPVPEIGEEDLLIAVQAAGICGSDIGFYDGHGENARPPVTLGHEFAGVVAKTGAKVRGWKPGDRVVSDNTGHVCGVCHSCATGDYLLCPERLGLGYGMDGGFAPFVRIEGDLLRRVPHALFPVPPGMPIEHAAALDPVANSYRAVVQEGRLLPGEDIVVFGVGALGLFSIQIARIAGAANVIAVGLSADTERFRVARDVGATSVIAADAENVAKAVRLITGSDGVGIVIDAAGPSDVMATSFDVLRNAGRFVKIGFDAKPPTFSLDPLLFKGITVIGHFGYDWLCCQNCMRLMAKGDIRMEPMITHRLPLERWEEGFQLTRSRKAIKVMLTPAG